MYAYTYAYSVCVILVGWLFVCVCVCASSVSMMAYVNIYLGLNIHDDYVFRSARVRIFIKLVPMFLLTSPRVIVLLRVVFSVLRKQLCDCLRGAKEGRRLAPSVWPLVTVAAPPWG